jgi:ABC-type dipeptide/oligopeptide/nickel transport system permease subunit
VRNSMILGYVLVLCWAALCFWLLYGGLTAAPPVDVKDIYVGMVFWMSLLSFPSSLLVLLGTALFSNYFNFSAALQYHPWFYCIVWACYFIVGLAQWLFVVRCVRWITECTGTVEADSPN